MGADSVERLLLDVREAAQLLGIGRSTLYELIAAGQIEVVHIGRSARVPVAALHAFVERCRTSELRCNVSRPPALLATTCGCVSAIGSPRARSSGDRTPNAGPR